MAVLSTRMPSTCRHGGAGRRFGLGTVTIGVVCLITGCVADVEPVGGGTAPDATATADATEGTDNGESTTTEFPTPTPLDPARTQEPREPARDRPAVLTPAPPIGGGPDEFEEPHDTSHCVSLLFSEPLFEAEATVTEVKVGPAGVFRRDDTPCEGRGPRCDGFVFPANDGETTCNVGVTWVPESGVTDGEVALTFSAVCTTHTGHCAGLADPPSPDGTPVTFTSALSLTGYLDDAGAEDPSEEDPGEVAPAEEDPSRPEAGGEDPGGEDPGGEDPGDEESGGGQ